MFSTKTSFNMIHRNKRRLTENAFVLVKRYLFLDNSEITTNKSKNENTKLWLIKKYYPKQHTDQNRSPSSLDTTAAATMTSTWLMSVLTSIKS